MVSPPRCSCCSLRTAVQCRCERERARAAFTGDASALAPTPLESGDLREISAEVTRSRGKYHLAAARPGPMGCPWEARGTVWLGQWEPWGQWDPWEGRAHPCSEPARTAARAAQNRNAKGLHSFNDAITQWQLLFIRPLIYKTYYPLLCVVINVLNTCCFQGTFYLYPFYFISRQLEAKACGTRSRSLLAFVM